MNQHPDFGNGVLLVDKPSGLTSHDVVDRIRRHFRIMKVGHAGTLDPQATGLLVIMLGRATKLADTLMNHDKAYEGAMRLGMTTDTQDADGNILSEADYSGVTKEALLAEMEKLKGDSMQTPPMVSAAKKNGVPLYKLARKGQTVERRAKLIHIYEFEMLDFELPMSSFRLRCSKGVYVRTICSEIGETLGCGAILKKLRRTMSGAFSIENARPLDEILRMKNEEFLDIVIPINRIPK